MTTLSWANRPFPFRATIPPGASSDSDRLGLLSVIPPPESDLSRNAPSWALRVASIFGPTSPEVAEDYFASPKSFIEMRLCTGPASEMAWEAVADLAERLRRLQPEGVVRIEQWCTGDVPVAPDPEQISRLRELRPLFIHVWVENEMHLTPEVQTTWSRLVDGGVPMAAEILLKQGAIASAETLRGVCLKLEEWRVRPYVMIVADWLRRRDRIEAIEAIEWVRGLRGWVSGLAVPQLVVEGIDGERVVRIPPYVTAVDDEGAELTNYEGRHLHYLNPPKG